MLRLLIALVLAAVAIGAAAVIQRRSRPPAPTRTGWTVPDQLDRADFDRPDAPWLVAVFSSDTCLSCRDTVAKAELLESADVAVQDVRFQERRDLHERYAIEAVPCVLVADADGVVQASYLGPPPAADLWAKLAELRDADPG